jgi:hypothetical protein
MTAPSAPRITVHSDGDKLRVSWQPVDTATDYKLYVGASANPTGLEADIADDDMGASGWFQYTFVPDDTDSYLRLTALNVGAEESGYSNEVRIGTTGAGKSFGTRADPFGNDRYPS